MLRPVIREFRHQQKTLKRRVEKLEEEVHKLRTEVDEINYTSQYPVESSQDTALVSNPLFDTTDDGVDRNEYRHWTECYIYAATGGMVGAFAILFAGCVSKLLLHDPTEGLQSALFYAVLAGTVVCLIW